jgi:hypothetical protein
VSNYTKSTDFAVKDSLSTGNPSKLVKGTEIDTEFSAIQSAVNSKADKANPTFTGTITAVNVTVSGSPLFWALQVVFTQLTQLLIQLLMLLMQLLGLHSSDL